MSKSNPNKPTTTTNDSDVTIVEYSEKQYGPAINTAAYTIQCILNAVQRQGAANLALLATSDKKVPITWDFLIKGFGSRLPYNFAAMGSALATRDYLKGKNTPQFANTVATAMVETFIGSLLEVNGSRPGLKKIGIDLSLKNVPRASALTFSALFARNFLTWQGADGLNALGVNLNLPQKMLFGTILGGISTAPHNVFNEILKASAPEITREPLTQQIIKERYPSLQEVYGAVWSKYKANPRLMMTAPHLRAVAGFLSAAIFSPEAGSFLKETMRELSESLYGAASQIPDSETPPDSKIKANYGAQNAIAKASFNEVDDFENLSNIEKKQILSSLAVVAEGIADSREHLQDQSQTPNSEISSASAQPTSSAKKGRDSHE